MYMCCVSDYIPRGSCAAEVMLVVCVDALDVLAVPRVRDRQRTVVDRLDLFAAVTGYHCCC